MMQHCSSSLKMMVTALPPLSQPRPPSDPARNKHLPIETLPVKPPRPPDPPDVSVSLVLFSSSSSSPQATQVLDLMFNFSRVSKPSWRNNNVRQDWLQRESSSSTSNIFGDFLFDEDNNQMLQPTEQSLAQSTSVQASLGEYQDWSAVERSIFFQMLDQPEQSLAGSAMARHDKNQDLFQSGPSSTSNTFGEDLPPLPTELFSNIQSHWPASTTQEHRISDQYLPVSQVVQTQKPTRSIREVINIPDSPENSSKKRAKNLSTVMLLSFPVNDTPAMKFPVEVNPSENVEVLRTELAKMQQRSQLLLPEGGYFFIHKTQILYEKQSFRWNRITQGDTIEIFPGSVADDHRTNTRT
ncbi:hypothetical protein DY000_02010917 [Brassica cretica]|uniref:Ubiquitin-like domain-containing protein n=1 Tax=Brassica cretica TaxID=69181 RepID=A0ABQ7DBZ8_BRACR|nr:hypothetical protein DY000_02010917 [Brassica cretica]